ncbi:CAP domain-containing protein [Jeotgalibaca arthritidis]|uniref:CAP domain-containing protein n=1 Tax=Jeotgalibaca arthritidis TaxID=1868794 RepID=UPI0035A16F31
MRQFLKRAITIFLLIGTFFYVVDSGLLVTQIVPFFQNLAPQAPTSESITDSSSMEHFVINQPFSQPDEVDEQLLRDTTLQLTNDLRSSLEVGTLTQNETLQQAADIRALESAQSFSHTRPDGSDFYTVLNEESLSYSYQITGENLALATYHLDDVGMAEFLFDGWVESPGHYQNMIEADFSELGVGIYYDGDILYLVQIFGTAY